MARRPYRQAHPAEDGDWVPVIILALVIIGGLVALLWGGPLTGLPS